MLSCTLYGSSSIVVIGFDELYPLMLATDKKYGNVYLCDPFTKALCS